MTWRWEVENRINWWTDTTLYQVSTRITREGSRKMRWNITKIWLIFRMRAVMPRGGRSRIRGSSFKVMRRRLWRVRIELAFLFRKFKGWTRLLPWKIRSWRSWIEGSRNINTLLTRKLNLTWKIGRFFKAISIMSGRITRIWEDSSINLRSPIATRERKMKIYSWNSSNLIRTSNWKTNNLSTMMLN